MRKIRHGKYSLTVVSFFAILSNMEQKQFKLTDAARILGISQWTLRRWVRNGKVPAIKRDTGRIYIPVSWLTEQTGEVKPPELTRCALYARESSSENKTALESQTEGLRRYAEAKGYQITHVVKEIASGVNDNRLKLKNLLAKKDFDVLIVEHKDRLTRFGFGWFDLLCPFRLEVVNVAENCTHDLMEDLVAILTSFSARLYGQRRGKKKTEAAIKALQKTE